MTATRGRPRKQIPTQPAIQINEEALASAVNAGRELALLKEDYTSERDNLNQLIGRVQMGLAIGGLANALNLQSLKSIKESKSYKSLAGQTGADRNGFPVADIGTWDGFCRALGFSPDKLDEDLKNLDAFGEEALSNLAAIGAGYRELRQYRKLPEDSKQALLDVAKTGDKEGFVELAEEIISKHVKEKETLTKQLNEATETLEAKDRLIANKNERIDMLEERAAKRFKPVPGSEAKSEEEQILMDAITQATLQLEVPLRRLFLAVDAALSASASEAADLKARQAVEFACQRLVDIANGFRITVDLESQLNPPWMSEEMIEDMENRIRENRATNPRAL